MRKIIVVWTSALLLSAVGGAQALNNPGTVIHRLSTSPCSMAAKTGAQGLANDG